MRKSAPSSNRRSDAGSVCYDASALTVSLADYDGGFFAMTAGLERKLVSIR
jgi:hypothetical protein